MIANLNSGSTGGQTFDGLPSDSADDVALYQTDSSGTAVFNFAVARVRYRALVDDAQAVRVFFRLFPALTVSLAYDHGDDVPDLLGRRPQRPEDPAARPGEQQHPVDPLLRRRARQLGERRA